MSRVSVDDSPYYLGTPTEHVAFPIFTKHGRLVCRACSADDAATIVYALNVRNLQFEEQDAEDLLGDLEQAQCALETAIDALQGLTSKTGAAGISATAPVAALIGGPR